MLTDDLTFTTPPDAPHHGKEPIEAVLPAHAGRWRLVPTKANRQLAFGAYRLDPASHIYCAVIFDVATLHGSRISEVVAFARPKLLASFGLPETLALTNGKRLRGVPPMSPKPRLSSAVAVSSSEI